MDHRVPRSSILRRLRRLRRDRRGSSTVEFVLWLPMFAGLIGVVADASLLLHSQARLLDVARDAARQLSIGRIDAAQADAVIAARMGWTTNWSHTVEETGEFVTTRLSVPFASVTVFGDAVFGKGALSAEYTMLREAALNAGPADG